MSSLLWQWQAPSGGGTSPDSYNLYKGTASGGETLYQTGLTGLSYSDAVAVPGQTYWGYVTAVYSGTESAPSNEISVTVGMAGLLLSQQRTSCWELLALNPDGTTAMDLTPYLAQAQGHFAEDIESLVSNSCDFTIASPAGLFDKYGPQAGHSILTEGRRLRYRKGFIDRASGTPLLFPAFYGTIVDAQAPYERNGGLLITVKAFDLLQYPLKQHVTTPAFFNTQANDIATYVANRYARFTGFDLSALDFPFTFVQFPDFAVGDIFKDLFDAPLYFCWSDYQGRLATRPRLGAAGSPLLGFRDATAPPDASLVAFTFPDATLVEMAQAEWKDYDSINQVTITGQSYQTQTTLGPAQSLFEEPDSSIDAKTKHTQKLPFGDTGGGSTNTLIAVNVQVIFRYSTNHHLDDAPRYLILGDPALALPPGVPSGSPQVGVGVGVGIQNEDPHTVGYVKLISVTPSFIILEVDGSQFSVGHPWPAHHGGFDYNYTVWGQPEYESTQTITAIVDYDPVSVTGGALTDVFGDHQTYQCAYAPVAMGTTMHLYVNGADYGRNSADNRSLDARWKADWQRGRVVFQSALYRVWAADAYYSQYAEIDGTTHYPNRHTIVAMSSGSAGGKAFVIDPVLAPGAADPSLYQTYRTGDFVYTFTGLTPGKSYDAVLHLAEPQSLHKGQRVFDVYANDSAAQQGLDIVGTLGTSLNVWVYTLPGLVPDGAGTLKLHFSPALDGGGNPIKQLDANGNATNTDVLPPVVCGIDLHLPQGQGAAAFAVNCGGSAITPTPPVVTADFGYSPIQQAEGIQNTTLDNPMLDTYAKCLATAGYVLRYRMWGRDCVTVRTASIPTVEVGQIVKFYQPVLGADVWQYVQAIERVQGARPGPTPSGNGGGAITQGTDTDTYTGFILYVQSR